MANTIVDHQRGEANAESDYLEISIDAFDSLAEHLSKAKALSQAALLNEDFLELSPQTIKDYIWVLNDCIEVAFDAIKNV